MNLPFTGVNVANLILVAACLIASALAINSRIRLHSGGITLQVQDLFYLAYLAVALSTATRSPAPAATIMQVVFLAAVWIAVLNLSDSDLTFTVRAILLVAFATAVASFAIVPLSTEIAFQPAASTDLPELRGIFSHQLRLGVLMGVAVGLMAIAALNGEFRKLTGGSLMGAATLFVIVAGLVAAFARLYTAAMLVALVLTIGLSKSGSRRWATIVLAATIAVQVWLFRDSLLVRIGTVDADLTLTGRTLIWAKTLAAAGGQNWLGFGYASFDHWSFDHLWGFYRPAHPHNSYIQAYFETGYLGLTITLCFIWSQLRAALVASARSGRYSYSLFLVLFAAVGSLTGSNYAGKLSLLFCLTYLLVSIESRTFAPSSSGTWRRSGGAIA